jgi:hypothetical protein
MKNNELYMLHRLWKSSALTKQEHSRYVELINNLKGV